MKLQRLSRIAAVLAAGIAAWAQAPTVIKTETKLVLVDVVATNKKGQYVDDLTQKNFRVWEDNKEQQVKTFSYGPDPASPDAGKRYIVLFFDSMSMTSQEVLQARTAAQRFIESNAGPDRLMLVAGYQNATQIYQNFTPEIDKLKVSLARIPFSTIIRGPDVASMTGLNSMTMGGRDADMSGQRIDPTQDFAARSMLQGLRTLTKNLAEIPGRKSLILFTSGFPLSQQARDEAQATIGMCNRSNVAIYSVDARGMTGNFGGGPRGRAALDIPGVVRVDGIALAAWPVTRIAAFFFDPQARGGGATGGAAGGGNPASGGSTGGGATGGAAGGGGNPASGGTTGGGRAGGFGGDTGGGRTGGGFPGNNNNNGMNGGNSGGFGNNNDPFGNNNPNNRNNGRNGPFGMEMPNNLMDRQQLLYMLADGTGGFVILNTNDLTGGLEKIAKEQNSYYILGYTPPESVDGTCHTLKVKVDRGGTNLRARAGYCNVKGKDPLAGNPIEKTMESRVTGTTKGTVAASMAAPFFYTGANTARVAVTMEMPTEFVKFEKVKGKPHGVVNVLGIAYTKDGSVAARFSDIVKLDFETQKEVDEFKKQPMHYENQFDIGSGDYQFKLVFDSGGESFGKMERPLAINAYETKDFAISGVALSKKFGPAAAADTRMDALLLEGRAPLVAGTFKFVPTGYDRFGKAENIGMYFEVYDPALAAEPQPKVSVSMRFIDTKANQAVLDSGVVAVDSFVKPGTSTVSIGLKLPVQALPPGSYKVEVKAQDSAGAWATRMADFEVMP